MRWTEEQERAIAARGQNLLLSAAAGSGKTTVLVERILRLILEEGADVDRMLVVTFTRAAASDMRAKLSNQLTLRAADGSQRCREQMLKLDRASICTLHAFCSDFLRANFETAGVDPAFRILDAPVDERLMDEALDETLEEAYAEQGPALNDLDYGRGPNGLREIVRGLCRFLESRPDPDAWLARFTAVDDELISLWMDELVRGGKRALSQAHAYAHEALYLPDSPPSYADALNTDLISLENLSGIDDYEALFSALETYSNTRAGRARKGAAESAEAKAQVQDLRKRVLSTIRGARILRHPLEQAKADARAQAPQMAELGRLAQEALRRYADKKAELSGLTYTDLEQKTLLALRNENTAAAIREQYDYIFVDEYQDTSDIQEAIVSRVCRADNRFMVGDVKQSIYRFRQAEPGLFIEKYNHYREGDGGTLLPLTRNFRSTPAILSFVNMIFERVMTGGDAEIEYDDLARLNPGDAAAPEGAPVEIHLMEKPSGDEDLDAEIAEMEYAEREALLIARRIRSMMAEDPGLRFSDFAILTRSKKAAFTAMLPILLAQNIPAYADGASGFFESLEIQLALSMLKLIANRRSDPELIGVLRSPVVGLNAGALAEVRIFSPDVPFVDAAARYAAERDDETARRLKNFFTMLDGWTLRSGAVGLGELVRSVLSESGFYTYAGALPGGSQRQANLDRLASIADRFDDEISGSLIRFLGHTDKMTQNNESDVANLLGENDDVVRMMTIHKSKGLEFKIVFGAMLNRGTGRGSAGTLRAHRDLGLAVTYNDPVLRTRRKTLAEDAIAERGQREDAAEEMRTLYVLLTRARERLILVGTIADEEKALRRWGSLAHSIDCAKTHLDLIMAARCAAMEEGEDVHSTYTCHSPRELASDAPEIPEPKALLEDIMARPDEYADPDLDAALAWRYPDPLGTRTPLKLTVSGLLRELDGPESLPVLAERPQFMQEESVRRLTGTERGTAYHRAMQLLDLAALDGLSGRALVDAIRGQMDNMVRRRLLSDVQREVVRPSRLAAFLSGDVGLRLRAAKEVHREWPFNVMVRAGEVLETEESGPFADEPLLVQGTVDCCFLEDGAWILLDYKTDRSDDLEALKKHYQKQLRAYALALTRITGIPVRQKLLCLLSSEHILEI